MKAIAPKSEVGATPRVLLLAEANHDRATHHDLRTAFMPTMLPYGTYLIHEATKP